VEDVIHSQLTADANDGQSPVADTGGNGQGHRELEPEDEDQHDRPAGVSGGGDGRHRRGCNPFVERGRAQRPVGSDACILRHAAWRRIGNLIVTALR